LFLRAGGHDGGTPGIESTGVASALVRDASKGMRSCPTAACLRRCGVEAIAKTGLSWADVCVQTRRAPRCKSTAFNSRCGALRRDGRRTVTAGWPADREARLTDLLPHERVFGGWWSLRSCRKRRAAHCGGLGDCSSTYCQDVVCRSPALQSTALKLRPHIGVVSAQLGRFHLGDRFAQLLGAGGPDRRGSTDGAGAVVRRWCVR